MGKINCQVLKGTRDFLPSQFIVRRRVIATIEQTFEEFGFEPMETPALEYAETLEEKYGEEGARLIYKFADRGGRNIALRYDLTVPLARNMAMYQIDKPFRRYQISPVWRADKPQKGRFREFWQCDADIVGSQEVWADAEMIGLTYFILKKLGFEDFNIRINTRKLLNGIALYGGIAEKQMGAFFRIIDKSEKIGWEGVKDELEEKGFSREAIAKTINMIVLEASGSDLLSRLKDTLQEIPVAQEGINELEEIDRSLANIGVTDNFSFDVSLARGLDYYTGPIFETVIEKPRIGSISGGGRYDTLIGMFSGKNIPATGTSLGLERIIAIMEELKMLPVTSTLSEVLVAVFDRSSVGISFQVASKLRSAGINTEMYVKADRLKKQFSYANTKGIPLVLIVGPDEREKGIVGLKDMRKGAQLSVALEDMTQKVKELLEKRE